MAIINIGEGTWAEIRAKINAMNTELYSHIGDSPTYTIGEGNWSTIRTQINSMYQELVLAMTTAAPTTTSASTTAGPTTTSAPTTTAGPTTTAAPGAYSSEYQAVYSAMTNKPSSGVADAQNTMVAALVSNGIWNKFDVFYCFANNDEANSLINWINPGTFNCTNVHSTVFTSLEGFTGDGVNDYINSNFNPSTNNIRSSLDNVAFGIYFMIEVDENKGSGVVDASAGISIFPKLSSYLYCRLNNPSSATPSITSSLGLATLSRDISTHYDVYKNNSLLGSVNSMSVSIPNGSIYFLARNGTAGSNQNNKIGFGFLSSSLTSSEVIIINTAIETYMDYNGKGVEPITTTAAPTTTVAPTTTAGPYGPELATNGTFTSNITPWHTPVVGSWFWQTDGAGGGWCRHLSGAGYDNVLQLDAVLTIGKTYHIVFTIGDTTAGYMLVYAGTNYISGFASNGTYSNDILCSGNTNIKFDENTLFNGYIDNFSCKEIL